MLRDDWNPCGTKMIARNRGESIVTEFMQRNITQSAKCLDALGKNM